MLRFKPASGVPARRRKWPDFTLSDPSTVLSQRPTLRKLVVAIDHELIDDIDEAVFTQLSLLGGLLSHPYIDLYRFSDTGPPDNVARMQSELLGEYVPGWIIVGDPVLETGHLPVSWSDPAGTTRSHGAIHGNRTDAAEGDTTSGAYADLDIDQAAARRRLDAIAVEAVGVALADLFITRRPYLHAVTWRLADSTVIATPEQALPLVSLYLRRQRVYVTARSLDGTWTDEPRPRPLLLDRNA